MGILDNFRPRPKDEITFNDIIGYEPIKDICQRAYESPKPINLWFNGVAGSAKTMFGKAIKTQYGEKAHYINCLSSSVEKTMQDISRVQKKKHVYVFDEFDKWKKDGYQKLLSLFEEGEVYVNYKSYEPYWIRIPNLKVVVLSNSTSKISKPMKSRFLIYNFPEYTDDEYREIVSFKYDREGINPTLTNTIIDYKLNQGDKDPRKAIELIGLLNRRDTVQSVTNLLMAQEKFRLTEDMDYN